MARNRELPRLQINPNLAMQQPGQAMFSPALPTSLQHGFHPPMPLHSATMGSFFPPGGPPRQSYRVHQANMLIAAAGIPPPPMGINFGGPQGGPMTPMGGHFPRPSSSSHPFPNRNRRQLSIGGPPKAVLGGPARKVSPLPGAPPTPGPGATTSIPPLKKKIAVNLPKETIPSEEEGKPPTRAPWARIPLPMRTSEPEIIQAETTSVEEFPLEEWRRHIPPTIDVFLPGAHTWDAMKQQAMEEKLEKLGVERGGSTSTIPHIYAPHARAASISSPADPALLLFKLNKLQQSQLSSAANSLAPSPQPPFNFTPSPRSNHGHSMSLAPSFNSNNHAPSPGALNPFGPGAILGFDQRSPTSSAPSRSPIPVIPSRSPIPVIYAPQGRVPPVVKSLGDGSGDSGAQAQEKPDFTRGFGLDIPEESEAELEEAEREEREREDEEQDEEQDEDEDEDEDREISTTAHHSRHGSRLTIGHTRDESRLSAALSFRSLGGLVAEGLKEGTDVEPIKGLSHRDDLVDGVEEWTGSEDVFMGAGPETSDDESIGEWSNPSDEERARQQRAERRRQHQPRRLPNFPRPPENTRVFVPRAHVAHVDDDIISNPSEEERLQSSGFMGSSGRSPRPLPPLPPSMPHSRATSGQHSAHDPAHAHSRRTSDNPVSSFSFPEPKHVSGGPVRTAGNLNPFAKPFVFGAHKVSEPAPVQQERPQQLHQVNPSSSSSFSMANAAKRLNAAAQEFKPSGFTFTFPAPVPTFPLPEIRPLPPLPPQQESPFKVQGRQKRQRTASEGGNEEDDIEEGDTMSSFKYPAPSFSNALAPAPPPGDEPSTANSFTFAGFSAAASSMPVIPHRERTFPTSFVPYNEESSARADVDGDSTRMADFTFPSPSPMKTKRAPIPLDFKHPVSSNTIPAGLFKALINGEERTRRSVRSRLSSHEVFDLDRRRPSLDDLDVQPISLAKKASRQRLVTDPGKATSPIDDVFGSKNRKHVKRRSSLPDNLDLAASARRQEQEDDDDSEEDMSEASSLGAQNLTTRLEMHHLEHTLDRILDEKMGELKRDISRTGGSGTRLSPETEAMITEVVSLFRAQLHDSAARGLDDSQADARGELDFELIKDVVEQGHAEILELLKKELNELIPRMSVARSPGGELVSLEQYSTRTVKAVIEAISDLSSRLESIGFAAPAREKDAIIEGVVGALTPAISSLRPEIVDYDYITEKLAHAVKPHISQLIDLASDKRETAVLIVNSLIPLLPSLSAPAVDTDALTLQLTTEVRRAIAPIDAFEIKEQVADLVVERLDSRLAVRDKAFNIDTVAGRVAEGVGKLLQPLDQFNTALDSLFHGQKSIASQQSDLASNSQRIVDAIADLPTKLSAAIDALKSVQGNLIPQQQGSSAPPQTDASILYIKSILDDLFASQRSLSENSGQLLSAHEDLVQKISALPDSFTNATNVLQSAHAEFALSRDTYKRELEDLRKSNTDFQVQVAKARGAHGQVRVEKDMLNEKLNIVEADRERLRIQVKELQTAAATKVSEASALEVRSSELEEALAKALARLQASDVATQGTQDKIAELEQANRDLISERQTMKSKVDSLDLQVAFASRDKDAAEKALASLQKQHDHLVAQQSHWDDLRRAAEQIESLTNIVGQSDKQELQELRRIRDRSKILEGEHNALQKRFKEQEARMLNNDKAAAAARNSLSQVTERAAEWERRANESEAQVTQMKARMDDLEAAQSRLDSDLTLANMQLEERDAHERLTKDRESKLRDTVAALEAKVTHLQGELERAVVSARKPAPAVSKLTNGSNGHVVSRPDSRASTTYGNRSVSHNRRSSQSTVNGSITPPTHNGAWDSMHNPLNRQNSPFSVNAASVKGVHAPTGRYPSHLSRANMHQQYPRAAIPSPTPSIVSATPTVDQDGWWS